MGACRSEYGSILFTHIGTGTLSVCPRRKVTFPHCRWRIVHPIFWWHPPPNEWRIDRSSLTASNVDLQLIRCLTCSRTPSRSGWESISTARAPWAAAVGLTDNGRTCHKHWLIALLTRFPVFSNSENSRPATRNLSMAAFATISASAPSSDSTSFVNRVWMLPRTSLNSTFWIRCPDGLTGMDLTRKSGRLNLRRGDDDRTTRVPVS